MRCVKELCRRAGFEPSIAITTDDPFYVRRYIELGLGIAFVPAFSWKGQFSNDVKLLDICHYTRDTYLFTKNTVFEQKSVKVFKELLLSVVK